MKPAMTRSEILDTAKLYVTKDRASTHGDVENSFNVIAQYWSLHLGTNVKPSDVAVMMNLLKCARIKNNPSNPDNWIDMAGYASCGGEIAIPKVADDDLPVAKVPTLSPVIDGEETPSILDDSGELTDAWIKKFRNYEKTVNYPKLQDIGNLMDRRVGTSTIQKVMANREFPKTQTHREIIAIAKYIGWRGYERHLEHWR